MAHPAATENARTVATIIVIITLFIAWPLSFLRAYVARLTNLPVKLWCLMRINQMVSMAPYWVRVGK